MPRGPSLVTIGRQRPFQCLVCRCRLFFDREIQLNSSGMEFFGMAWANQSAVGLVCADCGHVHSFLSDAIEYWDAEGGYPRPGR